MSEPWWAVLQVEWDNAACAVCAEPKWPKYPFCRSCSIKLQRAGMMSKLHPLAGHDAAALARTRWAEDWMKEYDRARDYLINIRRSGEQKHSSDRDREPDLVGPFPPMISHGDGLPCSACKQQTRYSVPPGMKPKVIVDLLKFPDFDFSEYPGVDAACKHCWRPLNGAAENLVRA